MTEGPAFIEDLAGQGMIDENMVTININPARGNWRSNITFGGVPQDLISGVWFDHTYRLDKLTMYNEPLSVLPLLELHIGDTSVIDVPENSP